MVWLDIVNDKNTRMLLNTDAVVYALIRDDGGSATLGLLRGDRARALEVPKVAAKGLRDALMSAGFFEVPQSGGVVLLLNAMHVGSAHDDKDGAEFVARNLPDRWRAAMSLSRLSKALDAVRV